MCTSEVKKACFSLLEDIFSYSQNRMNTLFIMYVLFIYSSGVTPKSDSQMTYDYVIPTEEEIGQVHSPRTPPDGFENPSGEICIRMKDEVSRE